jgi:hypothetical protein
LAANPDLYKLEGDGVLYVTTVIDDADVRAVRSGTLTASALKKKLTFKLGHTNSLARRCPQYRKCEQDQTHLWLWYYEVDRRYVAGASSLSFSFSFLISFGRTDVPPQVASPQRARYPGQVPGMQAVSPGVLPLEVCRGFGGVAWDC